MLDKKEIEKNHEICLELLDVFIDICERNEIDYYFVFGSALGAVRHKGFIPWDINIDILLTVEEYYKLEEVMKKERLEHMQWIRLETDGRFRSLLRRDDSVKYHSDPNVDVTVCCNAPENTFLRALAVKAAYFNTKMFKLKNTDVKRTFPFNVLKGISSIFPNSFYYWILHKIENINKGKITTYQMITTPSVFKDRETLKGKWLNPVYAEFEGRKVRIFSDCHEHLIKRYGENYLTPIVWEDKGEYTHAKKI